MTPRRAGSDYVHKEQIMFTNQGTRKVAMAVLAAGLFTTAAAVDDAGAQVLFSGPAEIDYDVWHGEGELHRGDWSKSVVAPVTPTASMANNTLALQTDLTLRTDVDNVGRFDAIFVNAWQDFTVTDLPVAITLNLTGDVDLINGGGATGTGPGVKSQLRAAVGINAFRLDGTYAGTALNTTVGPFEALGNTPQDVLVSFDETTQTFALAPGYNYTLALSLRLLVETPNPLPGGWIGAGTTVEAGSLSGNEGLAVTMNWQTLPEPTLMTLAAPFVLLMRRRRVG